MNKFKKILVGALVVASASTLAGAVACNGSSGDGATPNYYELIFEGGKNFDYVYTGSLAEPDAKGDSFLNGAAVKEGLEVTFKIVLGDSAIGTPEVTANGTKLVPDENQEYRFIISEDTVVKTENLGARYRLSLLDYEKVTGTDGQIYNEERRVKYYDTKGNEITGEDVYVESGSEGFKFKLWVSPYYTERYTVSCSSEVLDADADGFYTVSDLNADSEITVRNLLLAEPFPNREGCGDGTESNPYLISEPVDLYYLAVLTNEDNYGDLFSTAYYRLENDIDLNGEQMFVIGNNASQNKVAAFMGNFDGNGHKIHNFNLTDEVINQTTFKLEHLPYVGMFGVAMANNSNPAVIKNLTLENFNVTVHPGAAENQSIVGGIVGYGIGVEITNCHIKKGEDEKGNQLNADVIAICDNNQLVFMGGIAGRLQGAYRQSSNGTLVKFDTFVRGSSADVSLEGTGTPYAAGGIVGYLVSADISSIAYIANCHSSGQVTGAMNAGGIVGTLEGYSTVTNCYSNAYVAAQNGIISGNASAQLLVAYAGGIAGYAAECSVITGCYAANYTSERDNDLSARSAQGVARIGAFAGNYATVNENSAADLTDAVIFNNSTAQSGNPASVFTDTLGWLASEWVFKDGELPTAVSGVTTEYSVTVKLADGTVLQTYKNSSEGAVPVYQWYDGGRLPEYFENSSGRSWGYYLDKELTLRVPYGFAPAAADTVLYVGLADYSEVAGVYHLRATEYADSAYIELTADGRVLYRNGGLHHECAYAYNGDSKEIIIYASALATLQYSTEQVNGSYFAFGGGVEGGVLTLKGVLTLYNPSGSEEQGTQYVSETLNLTAVKEVDGFNYGEYVAEDGARYIFNKNGTGTRILTAGTLAFTYTVGKSGSAYTVQTTLPNTEITLVGGKIDTVAGKSVSLKDGFAGSWKISTNSSVMFTFDGIDTVTFTDGSTSVTENYLIKSGVAEFTVNNTRYKASINGGTLVINGQNYYVNDGFTGSWYVNDSTEQIDIALEGVGVNGYGYATLTYSGRITTVFDAQYDVVTSNGASVLRIYVGDMQYGELVYNAQTKQATGAIYSRLINNYTTVTAYLYDSLKGVWVSGITDTVCGLDGIDTVTFNGRSANAAAAEVVLRSTDGRMQRGTYAMTDAVSGTLTAGGETLGIKFNEHTNSITLTVGAEPSQSEEQITRRDSWYNVVLFNGSTTYTFDGKSSIGGNVKVDDGTTESTLTYTLADGKVTLGGYELTPKAGGFEWNGKTLTFNNNFVNSWIVSGEDGLLEISAIDGWFKANVSYAGGSAVQFTFNPETSALELIEDENGERVVTKISLLGTRELQIVRSSGNSISYYNCAINGDEDKWKGEYVAEDGSSWKFDGLGDSKYGSGTATFAPLNGTPVKYSYKNNTLGLPYISDLSTVFMPAENGESGYVNGGKTYKTVKVDSFYGRTVTFIGDNVRKNYFFDGAAKMWNMSGSEPVAEYGYEIVSYLKAELIDLSTGIRYNANISDALLPVITIKEQLRVCEGEGSAAKWYSFGVSGVLWSYEDGSYEKAYEYVTIDADKGAYTLTDEEGKTYDAVVTGNKITITEKKAEN